MTIELCPHGINTKFCVKCVSTPLSADQRAAVETIVTHGGFFFLTGEAGSGKSFVVNHLRKTVAGCEVCAMTGVAAQLIDGRTAHSFLGMRLPMTDDERRTAQQTGRQWILSKSKTAIRRVQGCRMLVIDEISMANLEFFGLMLERFEEVFMHESEWPTVVCVGDFLQLPPTNGASVFSSPLWRERVWPIRLTQQHRHEDPEFLKALNEIRIGQPSDKTRMLFANRIVPELPLDCVHLHSKNQEVDDKNRLRLGELPGHSAEIEWELEPNEKIDLEKEGDKERFWTAVANARRQSRLLEMLQLKPGARIVLLTNDREGRWVNGSTGAVKAIHDGKISVKLDRHGSEVDIERHEEDLLDGTVSIGKICQFPLRLAYSLTIHRSQGMTLDRVGVAMNDHFSPGQTYVALSRCRYLETLYLTGGFPSEILVDEAAIAYSKEEHAPPPRKERVQTKVKPGSLIVDQHILLRAIPNAPNKIVCFLLGVPWPLKAGWRNRVIGQAIPPERVPKLEEYIRRINNGESLIGAAGERFLHQPVKNVQPPLFKTEG